MKTVLILIEHFYPAYKGGGPIQSITNLISGFKNEYNIHVITSAYDLGSEAIMEGIKSNTWNEVILPQSSKAIMVWYAGKKNPGRGTLKNLFEKVKPDFIYLNGIFSYHLLLLPLFVIKRSRSITKIIICPRGMIQKGALGDKTLKKKIYLKALKISGLVSKATWHVTNTEEKEDVLKYFGTGNGIVIAMNIPKRPVKKVYYIEKIPGNLKLIWLSLIAEKKNLLLVLQLIKACENISLDIYGPVKDNDYWQQCNKLIKEMPGKVKYLGDIMPVYVQDKFSEYNASILLSKGENFGHALYESLSVGRPVITSDYTPWNNLEQQNSGWNLNINDFRDCLVQLNRIKNIASGEFSKYYTGAYKTAKNYFEKYNNVNAYKDLFSDQYSS